MMFDDKCTIRNKNRDWDYVAHTGSIVVFLARYGNMFATNASTLDQYIPKETLISHLGKSSFTCGILMGGEEF